MIQFIENKFNKKSEITLEKWISDDSSKSFLSNIIYSKMPVDTNQNTNILINNGHYLNSTLEDAQKAKPINVAQNNRSMYF